MWRAAVSTCGHPEAAHRAKPTISIAMIETMNAYVGTANSAPDSRVPRRLATVIEGDEAERDRHLAAGQRRRQRRQRERARGDRDRTVSM